MNLESLNYEIAANYSTSNSMAFKSKISAKHDINGIFNFIFKDIPENLLKFWWVEKSDELNWGLPMSWKYTCNPWITCMMKQFSIIQTIIKIVPILIRDQGCTLLFLKTQIFPEEIYLNVTNNSIPFHNSHLSHELMKKLYGKLTGSCPQGVRRKDAPARCPVPESSHGLLRGVQELRWVRESATNSVFEVPGSCEHAHEV